MRDGLTLRPGVVEAIAPHAERLGVPLPTAG
jgi:hypothetical protein